MKRTATSACLLAWFSALLVGTAYAPSSARAAEATLKVEALLIWGTNDTQSPDPKHKPVSAEVRKKLQELPFKWTNYFVVNRKTVDVPAKGSIKLPMSEKCDIEVKNLGNTTVEVSLFSRVKHVLKRTQALPKGETLVLGGNAPNATSWFVVLKQAEPAPAAPPQAGK